MNMKRFWISCLSAAMAMSSLVAANVVRADDPPIPVKIELAEGKLLLMAPESWKEVEPKSRMIQREFMAPRDFKEDEQARITFMPAGGGIDANIERWKGQFELADPNDAVIGKKEHAGQVLHLVDLKGTFKESMGGPGGPVKSRENYRMLAVIVETPKDGLIFAKMTGPIETVGQLAESWTKMFEALEAK